MSLFQTERERVAELERENEQLRRMIEIQRDRTPVPSSPSPEPDGLLARLQPCGCDCGCGAKGSVRGGLRNEVQVPIAVATYLRDTRRTTIPLDLVDDIRDALGAPVVETPSPEPDGLRAPDGDCYPADTEFYTIRCGWCGAYKGTVDPDEPCAKDSTGYIGPHQFGVYEKVIGARVETPSVPDTEMWAEYEAARDDFEQETHIDGRNEHIVSDKARFARTRLDNAVRALAGVRTNLGVNDG